MIDGANDNAKIDIHMSKKEDSDAALRRDLDHFWLISAGILVASIVDTPIALLAAGATVVLRAGHRWLKEHKV